MAKQTTIKSTFSLSGKGLHTGLVTTAEFLPAAENSGIRFVRSDLEGQPEIPANALYVAQTERGTVLKNGEAVISTIEHAMSALFAHGIDNCTIRVNGPEVPILDGSALPYVQELQRVGVETQNAEKNYFRVSEKMEFKTGNGSSLLFLPDDKFSVCTMIEFDSPVLSNQFADLNSLDDYDAQIAAARTFVFVREIEPLLKHNLIKGGDLDNAIVIYDKETDQASIDHLTNLLGMPSMKIDKLGYVNPRPLAFANEPARHKLLDLIGDLALIGHPIIGKVIATRPGHTANTEVARHLCKLMAKQESEAPVYDPNQKPMYDTDAIKRILPHRWPMLLVDKVVSIEGQTVIAVKNITSDEAVFHGHFPMEAIMPGVLIIESMAQAGGVLLLHDKPDASEYATYFLRIDEVRFRQKVKPGDTVVMQVTLDGGLHRGIGTLIAKAYVGKTLVTEAKLMAQIAHK
ncbi:MAG: bifunctional UDP-3-O-[3-hydroxymyristoyl] N-acetylglucosamine deacetylase/3-hydroxyacyl-ACP dehydratase [Paludibacteraceae bacterium]|nr:bifunctional UDP-3-O-[3-hydroxymyristoyl] N-acetylglucosamine deacetylase/3-hydroxyacyl-ACP dehydratase [Paludibacteraceae bacterium]